MTSHQLVAAKLLCCDEVHELRPGEPATWSQHQPEQTSVQGRGPSWVMLTLMLDPSRRSSGWCFGTRCCINSCLPSSTCSTGSVWRIPEADVVSVEHVQNDI
jgi:hypothetical protein